MDLLIIDRLIRLMIRYQTPARLVLVAMPFAVVWALMAVMLRWVPGILDSIKVSFANYWWEFMVLGVIPGAVVALCMTVLLGIYLWRGSATIFEGPEE